MHVFEATGVKKKQSKSGKMNGWGITSGTTCWCWTSSWRWQWRSTNWNEQCNQLTFTHNDFFIYLLIGLESILQSKLGINSQTVVGVINDEGFQSFKNCVNHNLLAPWFVAVGFWAAVNHWLALLDHCIVHFLFLLWLLFTSACYIRVIHSFIHSFIHSSFRVIHLLNRIISLLNRTIFVLCRIISVSNAKWDVNAFLFRFFNKPATWSIKY